MRTIHTVRDTHTRELYWNGRENLVGDNHSCFTCFPVVVVARSARCTLCTRVYLHVIFMFEVSIWLAYSQPRDSMCLSIYRKFLLGYHYAINMSNILICTNQFNGGCLLALFPCFSVKHSQFLYVLEQCSICWPSTWIAIFSLWTVLRYFAPIMLLCSMLKSLQ